MSALDVRRTTKPTRPWKDGSWCGAEGGRGRRQAKAKREGWGRRHESERGPRAGFGEEPRLRGRSERGTEHAQLSTTSPPRPWWGGEGLGDSGRGRQRGPLDGRGQRRLSPHMGRRRESALALSRTRKLSLSRPLTGRDAERRSSRAGGCCGRDARRRDTHLARRPKEKRGLRALSLSSGLAPHSRFFSPPVLFSSSSR